MIGGEPQGEYWGNPGQARGKFTSEGGRPIYPGKAETSGAERLNRSGESDGDRLSRKGRILHANQALGQRILREFRRRAKLQLPLDPRFMKLHGLDRHVQNGSNFLRAASFGD